MIYIFVFLASLFFGIFSSEVFDEKSYFLNLDENEVGVCLFCQNPDELDPSKRYVLGLHDECPFQHITLKDTNADILTNENSDNKQLRYQTSFKKSKLCGKLCTNGSLVAAASYGSCAGLQIFLEKYSADPNGLFLDTNLQIKGVGPAFSFVSALHHVFNDHKQITFEGSSLLHNSKQDSIRREKIAYLLDFMSKKNMHADYKRCNGGPGCYFSVNAEFLKICIRLFKSEDLDNLKFNLLDNAELKAGGQTQYARNDYEEWVPGRSPIFYAPANMIRKLQALGYDSKQKDALGKTPSAYLSSLILSTPPKIKDADKFTEVAKRREEFDKINSSAK